MLQNKQITFNDIPVAMNELLDKIAVMISDINTLKAGQEGMRRAIGELCGTLDPKNDTDPRLQIIDDHKIFGIFCPNDIIVMADAAHPGSKLLNCNNPRSPFTNYNQLMNSKKLGCPWYCGEKANGERQGSLRIKAIDLYNWLTPERLQKMFRKMQQ